MNWILLLSKYSGNFETLGYSFKEYKTINRVFDYDPSSLSTLVALPSADIQNWQHQYYLPDNQSRLLGFLQTVTHIDTDKFLSKNRQLRVNELLEVYTRSKLELKNNINIRFDDLINTVEKPQNFSFDGIAYSLNTSSKYPLSRLCSDLLIEANQATEKVIPLNQDWITHARLAMAIHQYQCKLLPKCDSQCSILGKAVFGKTKLGSLNNTLDENMITRSSRFPFIY